ncbi:GNAT family protein, partial [Methanospirillum hungatei]|uniref:GNAT family N-acetyltransferase n=1 Tax=Methanospirillum hungatei TaxID=2203 RepID=UPI0026EFB052
MHISTRAGVLRPWKVSDARSLTIHANSPGIARYMRDGFPSPYTKDDADRFIAMAQDDHTAIMLAIEVEGEAVGGIGIHPLSDVYRRTAEIGYWLSPKYQGRGIVTDAVRAFVPAVFATLEIVRIQAGVFHTNRASMRVLEKCGFEREAVHQKAIWKNGEFLDEHLYVLF